MAEDPVPNTNEMKDRLRAVNVRHWALGISFDEMIDNVGKISGELAKVKEVMETIRDGTYESDPGENLGMEIANMAGYLDSMGIALHYMGVRLMLLEEYE